MLDIFDQQLLRITRGNSADIAITLIDANTREPIVIGASDTVLFTAKSKVGNTVIKKELTSIDIGEDGHTLMLRLLPEDTMLQTGEYPYDVLLVTIDGQAITFISSSIIIAPSVGVYTDVGGDS